MLFRKPSQGVLADRLAHLLFDLTENFTTRLWLLVNHFDDLFLFFFIELWLSTASGSVFDRIFFFPPVEPFGDGVPVDLENFSDLIDRELSLA